MKIGVYLISSVLLTVASACAPVIVENCFETKDEKPAPLSTRGVEIDKNYLAIITHNRQSDHLVTLLQHIAIIEGQYTQTLTSKDTEELGISEKEVEMVDSFIKMLNEKR